MKKLVTALISILFAYCNSQQPEKNEEVPQQARRVDVYNKKRIHSTWVRDTSLCFNPPIKNVSIIPVEKSDEKFVIGVTYGTGTKFFYDFKGFEIENEWIRCIQVFHGEAHISWDSVYPHKVQYWIERNQKTNNE